MIQSIAKKEYISSIRDRRFIVIAILISILLIMATIIGMQNYERLKNERNTAQQTVNDQFTNSTARHPHRMAHYGSYAFRPKSPLSFLDFGIDSFTGTTLYMEAHRQNTANFSEAQQSTSLIRFGEMSVAFVLQILVPLLIIFLCFGAFSQEKETGTLKILLSQGVSITKIAWGKIKGYSLVVATLIYPAFFLVCIVLFLQGNFEWETGMLARYLSFIAAYSSYFFIFIILSVIVSAAYTNSSASLITLLGIWMVFCVIMPKVTANIGDQLYPSITKAEMNAEIHEEVLAGIDGHNSKDERAEAMKQELFDKYGVNSLEDLPVNFDGLWLAKGEEQSSKTYSKHFDELTQTFQQQNKIATYATLINPFIAIRNLSMGIAGSDFYRYTDFLKKAEEYRYQRTQKLNHIQATRLKYGDKLTRLDSKTWKEFEPFSYTTPGLWWSIKNHWFSVVALLFWMFLLSGLTTFIIRKSKIA